MAQQLPIPPRPIGIRSGGASASIVIEEFMDLQCPDCQLLYPMLEKVRAHYGDKVLYVAHLFPLWLHHQTFDLTMAMSVVNKYNSSDTWLSLAGYFFANQNLLLNSVWMNRTRQDFITFMAGMVEGQTGMTSDFLINEMNNDAAIYSYVDADIHLAILRGVVSTPTVFINGFMVNQLSADSSFSDWTTFIDSLIAGNWNN